MMTFELCPLEEWIRYISCKSIEIILSDKTILVVNDDSDIADLFRSRVTDSRFQVERNQRCSIAVEKIKSDPLWILFNPH